MCALQGEETDKESGKQQVKAASSLDSCLGSEEARGAEPAADQTDSGSEAGYLDTPSVCLSSFSVPGRYWALGFG